MRTKIFYAHSTQNDMSLKMYERVCILCEEQNKYKNINIIDTDDKTTDGENHDLFTNIRKDIDSADLFICDMTPDYENDNKIYHNANVMLEIGYVVKKKIETIFIVNKKYSEKFPSLLKGIHYDIKYENNDDNENSDEYAFMICDLINKYIKKLNKYKEYVRIYYELPDFFIEQLNDIMDVILTNYVIKIQEKTKSIVIFLYCNGGDPRILDINSRTLFLKHKDIDLTKFDKIYEEIKHIETLAHTGRFK